MWEILSGLTCTTSAEVDENSKSDFSGLSLAGGAVGLGIERSGGGAFRQYPSIGSGLSRRTESFGDAGDETAVRTVSAGDGPANQDGIRRSSGRLPPDPAAADPDRPFVELAGASVGDVWVFALVEGCPDRPSFPAACQKSEGA